MGLEKNKVLAAVAGHKAHKAGRPRIPARDSVITKMIDIEYDLDAANTLLDIWLESWDLSNEFMAGES